MMIHERFVEVDGLRTRCLDAHIHDDDTRATTIVLVPSMFLLARSCRPTLQALAPVGFRVIAPELAGDGRVVDAGGAVEFRGLLLACRDD
jgi:hypothetical protein